MFKSFKFSTALVALLIASTAFGMGTSLQRCLDNCDFASDCIRAGSLIGAGVGVGLGADPGASLTAAGCGMGAAALYRKKCREKCYRYHGGG